jgi:hypothetical protein
MVDEYLFCDDCDKDAHTLRAQINHKRISIAEYEKVLIYSFICASLCVNSEGEKEGNAEMLLA